MFCIPVRCTMPDAVCASILGILLNDICPLLEDFCCRAPRWPVIVLSWLESLFFQTPAASHIPQQWQGAHKVPTAVSSSGCSRGHSIAWAEVKSFRPPWKKCLQPFWEWSSISLLLHWHCGHFMQNYWHETLSYSLWIAAVALGSCRWESGLSRHISSRHCPTPASVLTACQSQTPQKTTQYGYSSR